MPSAVTDPEGYVQLLRTRTIYCQYSAAPGICEVPDYVCLLKLGPGGAGFDYWLTYTHTTWQLIDVSTLTKDGDLHLTMRGTGSGSSYSLPSEIDATIYTDWQFVMTQTPSDFRPMDARDPAANCPAFSPTSPTSDNCHITYQVGLVGPKPPNIELRAPNVRGAGRNLSAAPFSALPSGAPDGGLSSPVSPFTPGRGFSGAAMRPRGRVARPANQRPQPREVPTMPTFLATYNFSLQLPAAAPGAPPVTWLRGTSTNYTPPNTDLNGPDPDYVLEPATYPSLVVAPNGLSAFTPMAVDPTQPTTVVVTSHDFGGVAEFRATATVQAVTLTGATGPLTVDVAVNNGLWAQDPVPAPSDSPTRLCGTDFANHPFASLPVDQDCNGIADSWEAQHVPVASANSQACGGPPVSAFSGNEDLEPGAPNANGGINCQGNFGDGLTVRDEYRGFRTYGKDSSGNWTVQWVSTDPVGKQDAFFVADWQWPGDNAWAADSVNGTGAILARETPFIAWHRVQDPYAGDGGGPDLNGSRNPIQLGRSNSDPVRAYAIELRPMGTAADPATLGDAQYIGIRDSLPSLPIKIYRDGIVATGNSWGEQMAALRDLVVAHEVSHRLGLQHVTRPNCCSWVPWKNMSKLDLQHFTIDSRHLDEPIRSLYTRFTYYHPITGGTRLDPGDRLGAPEQGPGNPVDYPKYVEPKPGGTMDTIVIVTLASAAPSCVNATLQARGQLGSIAVWTQLGTIMDWKPRQSKLVSPPADTRVGWHYAPGDPNGAVSIMCLTPAPTCRVQAPRLPVLCQ